MKELKLQVKLLPAMANRVDKDHVEHLICYHYG